MSDKEEVKKLDLHQKLALAEEREQSAAGEAAFLAERVVQVKAERDALQRKLDHLEIGIKLLSDHANHGWGLAVQRAEDIDSIQQQVNALAASLEKVTIIAHCGGLCELSEHAAISLVRKVTIPFYRTSLSDSFCREIISAAQLRQPGEKCQ